MKIDRFRFRHHLQRGGGGGGGDRSICAGKEKTQFPSILGGERGQPLVIEGRGGISLLKPSPPSGGEKVGLATKKNC